jgi:hypothetical protein
MTVEFNLTNLIFVAIALVSGVWAAAKYIAQLQERAVLQGQEFFSQQFVRHEKMEFDFHATLGGRLDDIEALHRADAAQWQRVERELLALKADMPLHYVRREDYIRGQSVMEAKQDALYSRIELLQNQIQAVINRGGLPHG